MEEYAQYIYNSPKVAVCDGVPLSKVIVISNGKVPYGCNFVGATVYCASRSDTKLVTDGKKVNCGSKKTDQDTKWQYIAQLRSTQELIGPIDSFMYLCGLKAQQGKDVVIIPQFFTVPEADAIKKLIPSFKLEWLHKVVYPNTSNKAVYFPRHDTMQIYAAEVIARLKLLNKEPAHFYLRTSDSHHPTCWCVYCNLIKVFDTVKVKRLFEAVTDRAFDKYIDVHLAVHERGDFAISNNSTTDDASIYSFSLSLTEHWTWSDGGLTIFPSPNNTSARHVLKPAFGRLTVYKSDTPFIITEVTVPRVKYVLTGSFSTKEYVRH